MAPTPWKPKPLMIDLGRQVESLFDELIHRPWGAAASQGWLPAVDIHETADEYQIVVELPGVLPDEVEVVVRDRELTVRGRRDVSAQRQLGALVRIERQRGEFSRSVWLEHSVDPLPLESRCEQGLLVLRLAKRRPASTPSASDASRERPHHD